jgi:lysozyme family protein
VQENLDKALGFIFISEGGFAIRETEPGGAVNMGISMLTFAAWWAPHIVSISDLKAMTIGEATNIYQTVYANHIDFAKWPSGLDYCVLDASVNEGVAAALLFLSVALNFNPAPANIATLDFATCLANIPDINLTRLKASLWSLVAGADLATTINWICDNRLAEKRKRAEWPQFGPGWTNRVEYVRANSIAMLGTQP